jgi:hypothetical protein
MNEDDEEGQGADDAGNRFDEFGGAVHDVSPSLSRNFLLDAQRLLSTRRVGDEIARALLPGQSRERASQWRIAAHRLELST